MESEREGDLSEGLRQWLTRRAEETGVDRQELLTRAVAAYRLLDAEGEELGAFDDVEERLDAVESRVSTVEDDLDEKVADVRDRVVQVKRETDGKAATDHDHPDLADDVDAALEAARAAREETDRLEGYVEGGFENYEAVLEYLTETSETLDRRVIAVATVLVDLRSRLREMEATLASTAAVEEIQADANRHGTATADCGDCEQTVRIGLLGRPRCPHCEAAFDGFEPSSGFFGSATLTVGTRPALAGETTEETDPPEAIFDDRGTPEPPDTDGLFDADGADGEGDAVDESDADDDWADPDGPSDDGRADGAAPDEERPQRSGDGGGSA